ncbi:MAG TPA: TonB-dependent receptor [Sphingorhabdus sp.]|nr:TonB-dependent receptor [Sphingorhabdus sp.]
MKTRFFVATALAAIASVCPAFAQQTDPTDGNLIIVTAQRTTALNLDREAEEELATGPDAAAFIARQPGMALVDNGALSGQVQMRGLFGERIALRINGQHFATGGPNAMDPAMHYAPMALIDRVEIARGASPVRDGPGFGGGVNAVLKKTRFGEAGALAPQIDVSAQYRSVDDSVAIGGMAGLANDRVRLGAIASWEKGDDMRFPHGRVGGTSFERAVYGVHAGFQTGLGEISLEYRRQDTGRSGNPPFAMDIIYFHTDFLRAGFEGELASDLTLEAHADYSGVEHRMNNFALRPTPTVAATRQSDTYADTMGAGLSLRFGSSDRHIRIGGDFEAIDKGFMLYNPLSPTFFIHPLDRAKSDRIGAFAEARAALGIVDAELGFRVDRHGASTEAPRFGPGVPMGPATLARAFANADREWSATSVDAALRLSADLGEITPRFTLARKTRAPSLVERFAWLPTEASGGLADGNIYVGSSALKIEKAWLFEAGFDWKSETAYARPLIYYRRLEDFIQGVPFDATPGVLDTPVEMVSAASGDSTPLRFTNVDAEIYGADVAFGTRISGPLRLDGVASFVRGKRRDISDNLYRIAPANVRLALAWEADRWSLTGEALKVAKQRKVSATNGEVPSQGYVTFNLFGHWILHDGLRLDAGVENLFDKYYTEHLAGYNRNSGSDVALGARLPGAGRSAFIRLRWETR